MYINLISRLLSHIYFYLMHSYLDLLFFLSVFSAEERRNDVIIYGVWLRLVLTRYFNTFIWFRWNCPFPTEWGKSEPKLFASFVSVMIEIITKWWRIIEEEKKKMKRNYYDRIVITMMCTKNETKLITVFVCVFFIREMLYGMRVHSHRCSIDDDARNFTLMNLQKDNKKLYNEELKWWNKRKIKKIEVKKKNVLHTSSWSYFFSSLLP